MSSERSNHSMIGGGMAMVMRNKRYLFWFWLLDLLLTIYGTSAFRETAHAILDHSLYSRKLLDSFDLSVFIDLLAKPEFGSALSKTMPAIYFSVVFFLATALFLPGVFAGYASTYRLPREDFFRACGRNLWRFIRLMIIAAIVMGIIAALLFSANGAIVKKAGESTNERLPFILQIIGLFIIFLVMTTLRICFDLAEADLVLNDQRAVRKSIAAGFRHTFRSLGRLLGSYIVATVLAAIILVGGIYCWAYFIPSSSVRRAAVLSQVILFLLLIPRFWQRGMAVTYWQQRMLVPVVAVETSVPPEPVSAIAAPEPAPIIPATPPPSQGT